MSSEMSRGIRDSVSHAPLVSSPWANGTKRVLPVWKILTVHGLLEGPIRLNLTRLALPRFKERTPSEMQWKALELTKRRLLGWSPTEWLAEASGLRRQIISISNEEAKRGGRPTSECRTWSSRVTANSTLSSIKNPH